MKWIKIMLTGTAAAMVAQLFAELPSGSYWVDNLCYDYPGSGNEVSVAGCYVSSSMFNIPSKVSLEYKEFDGYDADTGEPIYVTKSKRTCNVTSISACAFAYCRELMSVTIPSSVTSIGFGAFEFCTGMTGVTIPSSVASIGEWAFYNCSAQLNFEGCPPNFDGTIDGTNGVTTIGYGVGYFKSEYANEWMAEIENGYWYDVEMHCEKEYIVHFDPCGGVGQAISDIRVPYNYSFALPTNQFVKEGYTFDGWSHANKSSWGEYKERQKVKELTSFDEVTLYAAWKGNTIHVTFNYGPLADKFGPRTYECTVGIAFHNFPYVTSDTWDIKGWFTQPMGGEKCYAGEVLPFKHDGMLFLQAEYKGPNPIDDPGQGTTNGVRIMTSALPSATEMVPYNAQLEGSGGILPYSWSVTENGYLDSRADGTFAEVGQAQGWREDDGEWACELPFVFNFCGKEYSSATVGANGYLHFDSDGSSRITIDSDDLYSENESQDIYVEQDTEHITFRWSRAVYSESENVVNSAITLYSNGTVRCSFGVCYGTEHVVSLKDDALGHIDYDVEDNKDLLLYPNFFPAGLSLNANTGLVSGAPIACGHYEFEVNLSDDVGSVCSKRMTIDVADNPNKKRDGSYSETIDGYTWYYDVENGEATIARTNQWGWSCQAVFPMPTTEINIPSVLGGCPVVGIGAYAFQDVYGKFIGSLTIPDSVTTIGNCAFYGWTITNLVVGASLCAFDPIAFLYAKVSGIELSPENTNLALQDGALYSVDWSELLLVGKDVTTLTIPSEMESYIDARAFQDCPFIETIVVEDGNERYEVRNGMLYDTYYDCVVCAPRCSGAETCVIPNGTRIVRAYAAEGADYQAVVLPNGLLAIEDNAFCGCDGISELSIPESVEYVGCDAFYDTGWWNAQIESAEALSVTTPLICGEWLLGCWYGDDFNGKLIIPKGVRALADYALNNGDSLSTVTLPASVDTINSCAFFGCYMLERIYFSGDAPTHVGASYWDAEKYQYYDVLRELPDYALCLVRMDTNGWIDDDGELLEYWPLNPDDPEYTDEARWLSYWTTSEPTLTIVRDKDGSNCRVILACETVGSTIHYTLDGSEPTEESPVYNGEIVLDVDTTILAYATSDDLPDSGIECWEEIPAQSELPLYWPAATNDGTCPWLEFCQSYSYSTFMQSGKIGSGEISFLEVSTNGALDVSFLWMTSSEADYDNLVFYVDGEEIARISGEHEFEEFQYSVAANGEHVLRWSYEKDGSVNVGEDCGRLVDVVIAVTESYNPIPDLGEVATQDEIYEALQDSADEKLVVSITNAANYNAYREWAADVKTSDGSGKAGAQAVKESSNAWFSFAVGSDRLISELPTSEDIKVDEFTPSSESGKFDFTVSIDGVTVSEEALKENLKQVFGLEGSTSLDPNGFSSNNVDIDFDTPENGKVKFTAGPKSGNADTGTFFMKVKVNP